MDCYMGWCSLSKEITFILTLLTGYVIGKAMELAIKYSNWIHPPKTNKEKHT